MWQFLRMLSIHNEKNAMGVTMGENDNGKLEYLNNAIIVLKSSTKATYILLIYFFDEGEGSQSGLVVEALLSY